MRDYAFVKKLVIIGSAFFVLAILFGRVPEMWFKHYLETNLSEEERIQAADLTMYRPSRLCLIFALDGVPYTLIRELHEKGYFKDFYPPGRLVSTFPSLTRPAFSKMLIGGKPYGPKKRQGPEQGPCQEGGRRKECFYLRPYVVHVSCRFDLFKYNK